MGVREFPGLFPRQRYHILLLLLSMLASLRGTVPLYNGPFPEENGKKTRKSSGRDENLVCILCWLMWI